MRGQTRTIIPISCIFLLYEQINGTFLASNALVAEGNSAACEVVWRKLHSNWIANQNPDEVFAYPSANGAQDDLARSPNFHAEHRAGQTLLYHTFDLSSTQEKKQMQ